MAITVSVFLAVVVCTNCFHLSACWGQGGGGRWKGLKTKYLPEKGTPSGQLASDAPKAHR